MENNTKIGVTNPNLNDVLYDFRKKGTIRIPPFQREYVWEPRRVKDLFDSIYRKFPIGSFFFWVPPTEYASLYKDLPQLELPPVDSHAQIKLVLDGQQRLTSLYCAAYGLTINEEGKATRDYKKICFDLDKKEFVVAKRGEDKSRLISVCRFFDSDLEYEVYDDLSPERRVAFRECKQVLSNYPLSVITVEDRNLEDAITIFERINQGGKRLNLFDLVVASTWSKDFDLKEKIKDLNSFFDEKGFGKVDEETVTQTLALVVKGMCTKSFQLQLTNDEISACWKDTVDGLKLAVDFVSENLGVKINDFLPYPAMLSLIAYLFIKSKNRSLTAEQATFLKTWFWRATFSQRYGSSTLTMLSQDRVQYFDPIIAGETVDVDYPVTITAKDISGLRIHTRSAIKNGLLCLLALHGPQHLKNDSPITLDQSICSAYNDTEKHHIFPKAFLAKLNAKDIHRVVNFTFLTAELNKEIRDKKPSDYFSHYKNENPNFEHALHTHLIPADSESGIWTDNYESFVEQRTNLFLNEIRKVTGEMSEAEQLLQESPDSAIKHLEKSVRSYLDTTLQEAHGSDYWVKVPQDVRQGVEFKMKQRQKRHPKEFETVATSFQKLTFCDVMDYQKIIQSNWDVFEKIFGSKGEVEKHFLNLKEYRNALAHASEMNNVMRKQGEASFEWLANIIAHEKISMDTDDDEESEESALTEVYCDGSGTDAKGVYDGESVTVLKGSRGLLQQAPAFAEHNYNRLRQTLIDEGVLEEQGGEYIFTADHTFSSPSAAAAVVLARSANGPSHWKRVSDSKPISELQD